MSLPWIFVSKKTNYKHQITNKSQISIFNDQNRIKKRTSNIEHRTSNVEIWYAFDVYFFLFVISNFGHWNLFDIWDLIFGISISQLKSNKANPFWARLFTFLFTWFETLPANQPAPFLLLLFLFITSAVSRN